MGGVHTHRFTMREALEFAKREPSAFAKKNGRDASRDAGRGKDWDLGVNWSGAVKLAAGGWPDGAKGIQAPACAVADQLVKGGATEDYPLADEGEAFELGAYLSGEPEHWVRPELRKVDTLSVAPLRICIGATTPCSTPAESIRAALTHAIGIAMAASAVRPVLLEVAYARTKRGHGQPAQSVIRVAIAEPGQPIDWPLAAFWVGHPATDRRIGFAICERCETCAPNSGYDWCAPVPDEDGVQNVTLDLLRLPAYGSPDPVIDELYAAARKAGVSVQRPKEGGVGK